MRNHSVFCSFKAEDAPCNCPHQEKPTHEIGWERGLLFWDKQEFVRTDEDAEKYTGFQCSVWVFKGDVDEFIRKTLTHQQKRIVARLEALKVDTHNPQLTNDYRISLEMRNQAITDAIEAVRTL